MKELGFFIQFFILTIVQNVVAVSHSVWHGEHLEYIVQPELVIL